MNGSYKGTTRNNRKWIPRGVRCYPRSCLLARSQSSDFKVRFYNYKLFCLFVAFPTPRCFDRYRDVSLRGRIEESRWGKVRQSSCEFFIFYFFHFFALNIIFQWAESCLPLLVCKWKSRHPPSARVPYLFIFFHWQPPSAICWTSPCSPTQHQQRSNAL